MDSNDLGALSGSRASHRANSAVVSTEGFDPARELAATIAGKLGSAQKRVLLSLTEDWGEASCHQTARRMFYGVTANRYTVVHHRHRTDNCWRLSNLGVSVKAALSRGTDHG